MSLLVSGRGFGGKFQTFSGLMVFYVSNNQINTWGITNKVMRKNLLICLWIIVHSSPFATLPISQHPSFLFKNQRLRGRACFIIPAEVKYTACYILQEETEVFITSRDYKRDIEK